MTTAGCEGHSKGSSDPPDFGRRPSFPEDYLAAGNHEGFGCIIVDIELPGMSGLELERRLTADCIRRPIVFCSARDEPEVRDEATLVGAVAFLGKPFDDESLLNAI